MFISNAFANDAAAAPGGEFTSLIMLAVFGLVFYFIIYRPQAKRVKEHKNLMSAMAKGDEVLTNGGIIGKIVKIAEENEYIQLEISEELVITVKKDYVSAVLPKGSMKSL
ncbi:preprotein translocase subunit YajC [Psychrobium sp. 1_MG-2023]|uniref:preprotein translocase subunit YajC n=1 Tax=Psychrobium sp. 1_MG-2023 TaxID=3062624 RepID=UPI000C34F4A0|nr:preprotein translocase subunit YajC [Psychrobium sp. 1_MG-2023]MDP2559808.1 preprotein translocase subunit YajC [Psychrobium sp. 1_MG-2023]PKF59086.1 preprotein translocase subunit YajC [Alteromonadales bacterium alter-6D02]